MTKNLTIAPRMKNLKCGVILPTYNNEKTLKRVIDGILAYTPDLIIVNDGATDSTANILKAYPELTQIHFPKNKGKGAALRAGFLKAESLGYDYAITIDSDGQHFPEDIPVFIDALEAQETEVLLIGDRNMMQDGIPKNSSFGNAFSSFWYRVETGIKLKDTQSGYRLYPLKKVNQQSYYTNKFEFEIEVIVKAAWNGLDVKNIPIQILYDEAERVSHFRPITDFARISVLNTFFVIWAFLYIKPRDYFRKLKKKGIKRFFTEDFVGNKATKEQKALSAALGVFIGVAPLWGFQTILSISLAALFRLNKVISFSFSHISLPPFIPFIIYGSLKVGDLILGRQTPLLWENVNQNFDLSAHLLTYLVGSFALAILLALIFGLISYVFFSFSEKSRDENQLEKQMNASY